MAKRIKTEFILCTQSLGLGQREEPDDETAPHATPTKFHPSLMENTTLEQEPGISPEEDHAVRQEGSYGDI